MKTIIDIHCHILPGVDDGSRSMEESIELLKQEYAQGVRAVIATPHYSRRSQDPGRKAWAESLRQELEQRARAEIDPEFRVWLGQELYYHEELPRRMREGFGWSMDGSEYVLVEFDTGADYNTIFRGLRRLIDEGYTPILAHMERFPAIRQGRGIEELKSLGVLMQMNYESLEGSFLSSEVRWCRRQMLEGVIDLMGTDMHRTDFRPPKIEGAWRWMQKHLPENELRRVSYDEPLKIIQTLLPAEE